MERFPAWRWWLAAVGAALGYVVGVLIALMTSSGGRAEASVLITSPRGPAVVRPLLPNLRELATSSVLAGNVRSTLRLKDSEETVRHRLRASIRPQSQVVAIRATGSDADHARQLAQEAAVVFTQLVDARFAELTPPLHATVFDAAHALSPRRPVLAGSLLGAGIGLALGVGLAAVLNRRPGAVPPEAPDTRALESRERLLERRIELVTARERAVARRMGELAARERSDEQLRSQTAAPVEVPPAPLPAAPPPAAAATASESRETVSVPAAAAGADHWNLNDLERRARERAAEFPESVEGWRMYIRFLRDYAAIDGTLPHSFDALVADVFRPLID